MGTAVSLFRKRTSQSEPVQVLPSNTPLPQSVEDLPALDRGHGTQLSQTANVTSVNNNQTAIIRADGDTILAIAITPRDLVSISHVQSPQQEVQCVPYTPHGDEASIFKYYCPLCMQYYRAVLKMKCCSNYLCLECCKEYAGTKRIIFDGTVSFAAIEEKFMNPNTISCPHCAGSGFHPTGVTFEEIIRDYSSRFVPAQESTTMPGFSPLRVGESFEDLKRKMIPFRSQRQPALDENNDTTPRSEDRVVVAYEANSLRRQGSNGIAFSPENRSPRMRLEPDTPDDFPQYVRLDDSKPVPSIELFRDDASGSFAAQERAEEKVSEQSSRSDLQMLDIARTTNEETVGIEPSPNEVRLSSPSPRFAKTLSARSEEKISPRENRGNPHGTESARAGAAASEIVDNVHMSVFASGVVDQLLRSALAQHSGYAVQ